MAPMQVKDVLNLAMEKAMERGKRHGRDLRRFVNCEFAKLMKRKVTNMQFGRGRWVLDWNGDKVTGVKFHATGGTKVPNTPGVVQPEEQSSE